MLREIHLEVRDLGRLAHEFMERSLEHGTIEVAEVRDRLDIRAKAQVDLFARECLVPRQQLASCYLLKVHDFLGLV